MAKNRLTADFYRREDTVQIAKELLGKLLVTNFNGIRTSGRITETEAYKAPGDKACHAYLNRKTKRTKTMFMAGGVAYIYLCYGIHHLFNVVTGPVNAAHAVLIRAIEPVEGIAVMQKRRGITAVKPQLTAGPGVMSKALGLHKQYDALSLQTNDSLFWIENAGMLSSQQIVTTPRIGIDYAEECTHWPWRFYERDNTYVSRKK